VDVKLYHIFHLLLPGEACPELCRRVGERDIMIKLFHARSLAEEKAGKDPLIWINQTRKIVPST
jgi:hypothetical protein